MAITTKQAEPQRQTAPNGDQQPAKRKRKERKPSPFPLIEFQTRMQRATLKQIVDGVGTPQQMADMLTNLAAMLRNVVRQPEPERTVTP